MRVHDEEPAVDHRSAIKRPVTEAPRLSMDKRTMSAAGLMHLQRTVGNSAVAGMLGDDPADHVRSAISSDAGSPLPDQIRQRMEPALGSDLSSVRVHTSSTAEQSAQALGAHAYTTGDHVVFGRGAYAPDSGSGQRTIAHELTHVVQQRSGPVAGTAVGGISLSDPSDSFERAAEASADRVTSAGTSAADTAPGTSVQREAEEDEED
jgi:Domain of unknown function (DUF4157)